PPQKSISTPPPTTEATNPPFKLPDLESVFQFNNRVTTFSMFDARHELCFLEFVSDMNASSKSKSVKKAKKKEE
ncbi:hypothetical protein Tco_1332256, partial [Tanacetum coccineum]